MRGNYLRDYGGPLVDWPGDPVEPEWAALYPIPESKRIEDRPTKKRRRAQQATDGPEDAASDAKADDEDDEDEDDDDDDFWLSPRMACRLVFAGCLYVDAWCRQEPEMAVDEMPPVVQPYAKGKQWMQAYEQAAMRLVRRLEKGLRPQPNCTAEEFALHMIIDMAKAFWEDGADEAVQEAIKDLPRSTLDEDFDLVSDAAFQDHDVLMLFDMPKLINTSELSLMMGCANLHPQEWFKPFKQHLTSNHV